MSEYFYKQTPPYGEPCPIMGSIGLIYSKGLKASVITVKVFVRKEVHVVPKGDALQGFFTDGGSSY